MLSRATIERMTAASIARWPERREEFEAHLAQELGRCEHRRQVRAAKQARRALGRVAGEFLAAHQQGKGE